MAILSHLKFRLAVPANGARTLLRSLIVAVQFLLCSLALSTATLADERLPENGQNNVWYSKNEADTVFVFVHGVLSDSRTAWAQEDDASNNWPKMIGEDPMFENPSIFLGGYYTDIGSGKYDMRAAANELYRSLFVEGVLDKPKIIFVAHSTGGIVVRHMLVRQKSRFVDKKIGLVLIASPSLGSRDASRLGFLTKIARHRVGQELQWDNPFLRELDKDFKNLVDKRELPGLVGTEWLENHYVGGEFGKILGLGRDEMLVEEESAARYFGEPILLADTTHFSVVKPDSTSHPAHKNLQFFYQEEFKKIFFAKQKCSEYEEKYSEEVTKLETNRKAADVKSRYFNQIRAEHSRINHQSVPYGGKAFYEIERIISGQLSTLEGNMHRVASELQNLARDIEINTSNLERISSLMKENDCISTQSPAVETTFIEEEVTLSAAATPSSSTNPKHQPFQTVRDCNQLLCPEMVILPAGTFTMGSASSEDGRDRDEGPQHEVTVSRPFALAKYEVTFEEYDGTGGAKPARDSRWGRGKLPVINVSWDSARRYCALLGSGYRLPTEAEWEYAARAGATTRYSFSEEITSEQAHFGQHKVLGRTTEVGRFPPNPWGLHDMHGNVEEWTADRFGRYSSGPITDPKGPPRGRERVVRGGSWQDEADRLRAASRVGSAESVQYNTLGFRCARTMEGM